MFQILIRLISFAIPIHVGGIPCFSLFTMVMQKLRPTSVACTTTSEFPAAARMGQLTPRGTGKVMWRRLSQFKACQVQSIQFKSYQVNAVKLVNFFFQLICIYTAIYTIHMYISFHIYCYM